MDQQYDMLRPSFSFMMMIAEESLQITSHCLTIVLSFSLIICARASSDDDGKEGMTRIVVVVSSCHAGLPIIGF